MSAQVIDAAMRSSEVHASQQTTLRILKQRLLQCGSLLGPRLRTSSESSIHLCQA